MCGGACGVRAGCVRDAWGVCGGCVGGACGVRAGCVGVRGAPLLVLTEGGVDGVDGACSSLGFTCASPCSAFLDLAVRMGDVACQGLAHNCLGVDLFLIGRSKADRACLDAALHHHMQHAAIGDDAGKFIAYTNAGLVHDAMEDYAMAARCHQRALQLALTLMSPYGQSVAVGNLGVAHQHAGDAETARACWDQHMLLARGLRDKASEAKAALRLGALANQVWCLCVWCCWSLPPAPLPPAPFPPPPTSLPCHGFA